MKRIIFCMLMAILSLSLPGMRVAGQDGTVPFRLEAHRGICNRFPENTLLSFEAAAREADRYQGMETDVQMTSDGVLVLMHDDTIDRTTDATGAVSDYTWAELQQVRIDGGYGWDDKYAGQLGIPRFEEYLAVCKKAGFIPYVEFKRMPDEGVKKTIDALRKAGFTDNDYVLTSFHRSCLEAAARYCDAKCEYMKTCFTAEELEEIAANTRFAIRPSAVRLDEATVLKCRELGLELECWGLPVADKALLEQLKAWGVRGVTCNDNQGL